MDYNVLRKIVASCVMNYRDSNHNIVDEKKFKINISKLKKKVKELGLVPVVYKNSYESRPVTTDDIILLSEYFKGNNLKWFDGIRSFEYLVFIREEDIDENLQNILGDLTNARLSELNKKPNNYYISSQNPVINDCCEVCKQRLTDTKSSLISIISSYPCYTAVIAKWVKKDSICLNIRFRANSLLINSIENDSKPTTPPELPDTGDDSSEGSLNI